MSKFTYNYSKQQLTRLMPIFATVRPGFQQNVEVNFTVGKNDPIWKKSKDYSGGFLISANVVEEAKVLSGAIALDLLLSVRSGKLSLELGGGLTSSKSSINETRENLFQTLIHELQHVLQAWLWGDAWENRYDEARYEAFSKNPIEELKQLIQGNQSYVGYNNRYEISARDVSNQWISENKAKLSAGLFDDLIPISELKKIVLTR